MPRLDDAVALYVGAEAVTRAWLGAVEAWAPSTVMPPDPPERISSLSGALTGTGFTVIFPDREPGDYLTLIVSSNQAPTLTFGAGAASATPLASAGNRLQAVRIVPADGATQVSVTSSTNAVFQWWISSWRNVDPAATVDAAAANLGNNTSAAIDSPPVSLGHIASGREVFIRAASVNATAIWAGAPTTVYSSTSGNAALSVRSDTIDEETILVPASAAFDRGNEGVTRNESTLAFVLQPVQTVRRTLLTNGSFETAAGNGVATGWEIEGSAPRAATCSLSTTGAADGAYAQRVQFVGQAGDSGNIAIYQAPIDAQPGDVLRASIYLSGTLTDAYAIFGIEGFLAGGVYIDEHDTVVTAPTGTPVLYQVEYTCPAGTDYVAVYLQAPGIVPTSVIDLYLDRATLEKIA